MITMRMIADLEVIELAGLAEVAGTRGGGSACATASKPWSWPTNPGW